MIRNLSLFLAIAAITIMLVSCGQLNRSGGDRPQISGEETNWQAYDVNHSQMLNMMDMHDNTRMEAADQIASYVKELERVADAVAIRTDRQVYVGIKLANTYAREGDEMSPAMQVQVLQAVRAADAAVTNVHASSRPEVYDTIKRYRSKLMKGVSDQSLVQSFSTRMQSLFQDPALSP